MYSVAICVGMLEAELTESSALTAHAYSVNGAASAARSCSARQRPGGVGHQKAQHSAASAPAGASSLNLATGGLMHPCIVKV